MPDDNRPHANRFSRGSPAQEGTEVRTAPFVLGDDTGFVGTQNAADPHCEIGESLPMFAIALGGLLWPTNGVGTPATSLKQSDVIPASSAAILCSLSARICSRKTAMRFSEIFIGELPPCRRVSLM